MLGSLPGKTRATNHCFVYEMYTVNLNEFIALKLSETGFSCGMLDFRAVGSKSRTIFLDVTKFAFIHVLLYRLNFFDVCLPRIYALLHEQYHFSPPSKIVDSLTLGQQGVADDSQLDVRVNFQGI